MFIIAVLDDYAVWLQAYSHSFGSRQPGIWGADFDTEAYNAYQSWSRTKWSLNIYKDQGIESENIWIRIGSDLGI